MSIDLYTLTKLTEEIMTTPQFVEMQQTVENSPWHREDNVLVHTQMVIQEYIKFVGITEWTINDLCGYFAVLFHDVGKPAARTQKQSETRGVYYSYPGHEQVSARLWEDWAVSNFNTLADMGLDLYDVYRIGWMIEHHLPYKTEKTAKIKQLGLTVVTLFGDSRVFGNVLLADQYGRVSDDMDTNRANAVSWVEEFSQHCELLKPEVLANKSINSKPNCFILIGSSGSGKSTFTKRLQTNGEVNHYSWDDLRLQWYGGSTGDAKQDYKIAFQGSVDDSQFNQKAQTAFIKMLDGKNVVVDNTNLSAKRRRFFVDSAKQRGYNVVGVLFPITITELQKRHSQRTDKQVPLDTVKSMYMSTQYPSFGEVDTVITVNSIG